MLYAYTALRRVTLTCWLCLPGLVMAGAQDDLLSALDAYHANDMQRLARIAGGITPDPLSVYPSYWLALMALDRDNDLLVTQFLTQNPNSVLTERIRRDWLKKLGKRQNWAAFETEWAKLPAEGRDDETQCYADLLTLNQGRAPANLNRLLDGQTLPEGCNTLITAASARNLITQDGLWQRLRWLLANNYVSQARQLAHDTGMGFEPGALNNPGRADMNTRQGQEVALFAIETKGRINPQQGAAALMARPGLSRASTGFAWGQLALQAARKQQMADSLQWFAQSDRAQLNSDQWEWWARAALRSGQWSVLQGVIQAMPATLANKPSWQYWQARALASQNHKSEATALWVKASLGSGYYSLLALDELGSTLHATPDKSAPSASDTAMMQNDPALARALELYAVAQTMRKPELRSAAQNEWRWSMRGRSDLQLLAASDLARQVGFYDMAIYSAERTQTQHDFSLRYLMPYRDITQHYASQLKIDDAWVYGLIRQESRFITVAHSGVGATGLMQLMPKTARWVAQKIGIAHDMEVNDIETNIQLGTWYLKYVLDSLSGNLVLATAAYNAGPSRARAWQDSLPMEGAIYAETIPFSETRDYVQKVMANAAYYGSAMGHSSLSLKARMGTIPARGAAATGPVNVFKQDPTIAQ